MRKKQVIQDEVDAEDRHQAEAANQAAVERRRAMDAAYASAKLAEAEETREAATHTFWKDFYARVKAFIRGE
jgi:membrane protein involved in colicin uptake